MRRNDSGATTGLIIACIFGVLLVGWACFQLAMMLSGNREVSNAVDAGILNTARMAIDQDLARVDANVIGATDFAALGDTPLGGSRISLLTYNRAVAQTLLVALNAQAENTTTAINNANLELNQLKMLGTTLKNTLSAGGPIDNYFDSFSSANPTKMMGTQSSVVRTGDITTGYMRPGGKTNVYFSPSQLPANANVNALVETNGVRSDTSQPYIKGYQPFEIGLVSGISGAPVFPRNEPHLVALNEFNYSKAPPMGYEPPNSFKANAQVQDPTKGTFGGAVATAIVGAWNRDYVACIPRGYIRIHNLDDGRTANNGSVVGNTDGSNCIFNNELYVGNPDIYGGIDTNNNVFTTDFQGLGAMNWWIAYAQSKGPDPLGHNARLDPLGPGGSAKMGMGFTPNPYLRYGSGYGQMATIGQLLTMRGSPVHCDCTMYDGTEPPACDDNMQAWNGNYGRNYTTGQGPNNTGFTNVEFLKAEIIDQFGQANESIQINAPPQPSGMKIWNQQSTSYPAPGGNPVNFGSEGTPAQLLAMAGSCAIDWNTGILAQLLQRCCEICPTTTGAQLAALLAYAPLPLNGYMYIYMPTPNSQLIISQSPPPWAPATPITPDGMDYSCTTGAYNIRNTLINSISDCNVHEEPYSKYVPNAGELMATDTAIWKPSSGYQNFLGELRFEETIWGGGTFSKPE
jgi:hypothetical protein